MNIENGMYIKAEIRAIKYREVVSKKTGEVLHFCSLVVEEGAELDKKELLLSRSAMQKGLPMELSKLVGKICLIPFYVSFRDGYLNSNYKGSDLPIVFNDKLADKPTDKQAAA